MKLIANIDDREHHVTLDRAGLSIRAQIDDRCYELTLREFSDGGLLLIDGSELHNCQCNANAAPPGSFSVNLRGSIYEVQITDPKRLRSGQAAGTHDHGEAQIRATMPGKVVRILVELGATVEAGAGIVVVEAMKMQNELKTPKAGSVTKLNAVVGETVNAGDVLAVVE